MERPETEPVIQNESGRLWDLVFMAAVATRAAARHGKQGRIAFELFVVPRGDEVLARTQLDLHAGPGDQGEPVVTVMLPGED